MRRTWLPLALLFAITAVVTAVARMPLAMVLLVTGVPLQAEKVSGTVWNGEITNAWVAGYPVGQIDVSGKLLPLLTGRVAADLRVDGRVVRGTAEVMAAGDRLTFTNTALTIDLAALQLRDAFGAPMVGVIRAETRELMIDGLQCAQGQLAVVTDTLQRSADRYGVEGFPLIGTGECQDGAMVLPLHGEGVAGEADATIRVSTAGYQTELAVVPVDPEFAEALRLFGFQQQGNRYTLIQRGEIGS